jgi:phospholipase/carboxylesterase
VTEEWIELGGLRALAVGDRQAARVVMVLSHGFQMEPADLAPFAHSIRAPAYFLFPEAPQTAEPRGRAWWFIDAKLRDQAIARGPRDFAVQHPPDLPAGRARLLAFLEAAKEIAGARPLVAGGFSQGGMLTCDTLLRSGFTVDAMALFSASRIAFDEEEPLYARRPFAGLPVVVSHGQADPDLSFAAGEALRDALVAAGADVAWVPFAEGHEIPLVVWRRLRMLLLKLAA